MKLFKVIGLHDLDFFWQTLIGITRFEIIINLDSCFAI